ncbi:MAG: tetratricopeptide repeat protein [candidate division Zixibacteria bacterium]|nr:tetratricopeptide repeat protein [candidate division Zixibacteria bacterium]
MGFSTRIGILVVVLSIGILSLMSCSERGMDNYKKAEAFRKIGEYEKAITEYKVAIELDPANAQFYFGLALVYEIQGDFDNALKRYEQAIKLSPENKEYLSKYNLVKGMILLFNENYEEATTFLTNTTDPKKDSLLLRIKDYFVVVAGNDYSEGRYRNSEKALQNALKTGLSDDSVFYALSKTYDKLGDNKAAIEYLKRAISQNPKKGIYHYDLGNIYLSDKKYDIAINEFEKAADYRDAGKLLSLCKRKIEEQKQGEAEKHYIAAKKYFSKKSQSSYELEEAKNNVGRALSISPETKRYIDLRYRLLVEELRFFQGNALIQMAVQDKGIHTESYTYERKRSLYVWIRNTSSSAYHVNPNHFTMVGLDGYSYHYDGGSFPAVDLQPGTQTRGFLYFPTTSKPKKLICDNFRAGTISRTFPVR